MYFSARERLLLEALLSTDEDLTVKQLAQDLGVSERTVHRDLKGIEKSLRSHHLTLLKKSGVGIRIAGAKEDIEALRLALLKQQPNEYTPEERQTMMLCTLLEAGEPTKLVALANDLNVTIGTVSSDLTKLEGMLHDYNLQLIRKRGYGVELVGEEESKRKLMSDLISTHLDESEFLSIVKDNIRNKAGKSMASISEKLLGLVEKEKLIIVERVIEEIHREWNYHIADSAYIGLVVHLALAIERIQQGENIHIDSTYLESLKATPEYNMAEKISRKLEQVFQIDIPEAETGYITMHLQGAKLRYENELMNQPAQLKVAEKAKSLIDHVGRKIGVDFTDDFSLFQGLVTHLAPALFRVKQRMRIHNPLLEKIKQDYASLFDIVKDSVTNTFPELNIPDEEIGFIVLHFGSSLLKHKDFRNIKVLVICSSGIGTSKILSTRLKKEIPELKDLQNVSLFQFGRMDPSEYDLILSTIKLPDYDGEYIVVSPILTQEEIKRIREALSRKTVQKMKVSDSKPKNQGTVNVQNFRSYILAMNEYAEAILSILDHFSVYDLGSSASVEEALRTFCANLEKRMLISDARAVTERLLEREKFGGLGIPNTRLALYHTRNREVYQPSFTIGILRHPLCVKGMDEAMMQVDHLLLMLAPEAESRGGMDILSLVSSLIIENTALFESGDQESIKAFLASKFDQFLHEKIQEMRNR